MAFEDAPGAELPDAAVVMLETRLLNRWLGTGYSLEEVAVMLEREPFLFELLGMVRDGMEPRKDE